MRFIVEVDDRDLRDMALNAMGQELPPQTEPGTLSRIMKEIVTAGLQEYIGEAGDVKVTVCK